VLEFDEGAGVLALPELGQALHPERSFFFELLAIGDGGIDFGLAIFFKTVFKGGIFQLLGEDGGDVDRPPGVNPLVLEFVERSQKWEIALSGGLVNPVGPVRTLTVTEHVRHVGVETKKEPTDRHEAIVASKGGYRIYTGSMKLGSFLLSIFLASALIGCKGGSSLSQGSEPSAKLSEADSKEALKDLMELVKGAKGGDPTSANFAYEPKTEFGRDFKDLFKRSAANETKMAGYLEKSGLETLLSAKRLGTKEGIAKSRSDLKNLEKAFKEYYDEGGQIAVKMIDIIRKYVSDVPDSAVTVVQETRQMANKSQGLIDSAGKVIDAAETGHAKYDSASDVIRFASDSGLNAYNKANQEFSKVATEHDAFIQGILVQRQARFSSGLSRMQTLTKE